MITNYKLLLLLDCFCNKGVKDKRGCDSTGQCECKVNFEGVKCGKCAPGYFDFQNDCKGEEFLLNQQNIFA